jgi:hypothetical protein
LPNAWFRFYHEWDSDPKVQMMSEPMQRRLAMLFCWRCKGETFHVTRASFHWRITETEMAETKELFMQQGFIDANWNLVNWNRRQFLSDSSTERVRRHRQALKQNETLQETVTTVTVTAPDTDTDTETDTEQKKLPGLTPLEPSIRLEDFADSWNQLSGKLPKVQNFTDGRKKKVKTRIAQGLTLDRWHEAVKGCATKPFLLGDNGSGWTATFDWLIANAENVEKAITNPYGGSKSNGGFNGKRYSVFDELEKSLAEDQDGAGHDGGISGREA